MYTQDLEFYETSEIDLAAFLSVYFPVRGTDKRIGGHGSIKVAFQFDKVQEVMEMVTQFREKRAKVEPMAYYFALREIRSRINETLK